MENNKTVTTISIEIDAKKAINIKWDLAIYKDPNKGIYIIQGFDFCFRANEDENAILKANAAISVYTEHYFKHGNLKNAATDFATDLYKIGFRSKTADLNNLSQDKFTSSMFNHDVIEHYYYTYLKNVSNEITFRSI